MRNLKVRTQNQQEQNYPFTAFHQKSILHKTHKNNKIKSLTKRKIYKKTKK
jgi:hypothetical protein